MTSPQAVFQSLYDGENDVELDEALETPPKARRSRFPTRAASLTSSAACGATSSHPSATPANVRSRLHGAKVLPDPFEYLVPLSEAARSESYVR
jgi:hypothetical protein